MLWRRAAIVSSNTSWHSQQHVPSVPSAACTRQSLWLQWHSGSQTLHQRGQRRESQMHCPAAACDGTISHIANPASSRSRSLACRFSSRELLPYPEAIDSYQQLLCDVLHVAPPDAQLILLTSPAVVTLTRAQLSSNWEQLQQLLPVRQQMLVDVFIQLPDLLIRPQDTVAARLHQASEVLQRPVHQLRSKQRRWTPLLHWKLMTMQPQELVQKVLQIQQLLGLHQQPSKGGRQQSGQVAVQQQQWQHVVSLVCDDPRLLGADQAQLLSTVEALEQVCAWPAARLLPGLLQSPPLLMRPAGELYTAASALQQQLKLSEEGLALALKRAPGALLAPADQLQGLLLELSCSLAVSTEVAADICLQEPQVLLRRQGGVGRVLTVLRSVFRLSSEELLQVVEFDPSVLCRSAGELSESSSRFREVAHAFKPWAAEYKRLMTKPVNVARAVRIEPLRLQRLVYLHRRKLARTLSLKAAVSMSGRQFALAYPGYSSWLAEKYSAGNAPRQFQGLESDEDEDEEEAM